MSGVSEEMGAQPGAADASGPTSPESSPLRAPVAPPVTDADVRAAWDDYYARPMEFGDIPVLPPEHPAMWRSDLTLAALRRVLEADRKRVADRV